MCTCSANKPGERETESHTPDAKNTSPLPKVTRVCSEFLKEKKTRGCSEGRRTYFGVLLEDADGEVGVGVAAELLESDRSREPRAHDHHVVAQRLPPVAEPPRPQRRGATARRARAVAGTGHRRPCRGQHSPRGGKRRRSAEDSVHRS
jgi:hypothetical protein